MKAGDVSKVVPSIGVNSSLDLAMDLFKKESVDSLVVLDGRRAVGVLSAFEVLEKTVDGARLDEIVVKEVMNHNILAFETETDVEEAARTMLAHKHWMAVVTEKGVYKGVVTAGSLVKALNG